MKNLLSGPLPLLVLLATSAQGQAPAQTPAPAQPLLERLQLHVPGPPPTAAPARHLRLADLQLNVPNPAAAPAPATTEAALPAGGVGGCDDCRGTVVEGGQRWTGRWHYGVFLEGTIDIFGGRDSLRYGRVTAGRFDKPVPGTGYRYANASFVPLGSSEAIAGFINDGTGEFEPDLRYFLPGGAGQPQVSQFFQTTQLRQVRADAPAWLREVYGPRRARQARQLAADEARWAAAKAERTRRAAQAAYDAAHPPAPAYSGSPYQSNAPAARPSYQYQPTEHQRTCIPCGGHGWVDGNDYRGQRSQCSRCGGRGYVMEKY